MGGNPDGENSFVGGFSLEGDFPVLFEKLTEMNYRNKIFRIKIVIYTRSASLSSSLFTPKSQFLVQSCKNES